MQSFPTVTNGGLAGACARSVFEAVPPVTWFIRRHMREGRAGLSLPQCRTMCLLDVQPAASLSTIADFLGASLPAASRMVSGLVEAGFVSRCDSADDRRQIALALTPRGQRVMSEARRATERELAAALERISPREQEVVIEAMGILRGVFGSVSDVSQSAEEGDEHPPGRKAGASRKRSR